MVINHWYTNFLLKTLKTDVKNEIECQRKLKIIAAQPFEWSACKNEPLVDYEVADMIVTMANYSNTFFQFMARYTLYNHFWSISIWLIIIVSHRLIWLLAQVKPYDERKISLSLSSRNKYIFLYYYYMRKLILSGYFGRHRCEKLP